MSRLLPILFNSEMVRAILDGRKTVTRRVIKPQPEPEQIYKIGYCIAGDKRNIGKYGFGTNEYGGRILFVKPPCKHGDILYVRETWTFEEGKYYYRADFDSDFWSLAKLYPVVIPHIVEIILDVTGVLLENRGLYGTHLSTCQKKPHVSGYGLRMCGWSGCRISRKNRQNRKEAEICF